MSHFKITCFISAWVCGGRGEKAKQNTLTTSKGVSQAMGKCDTNEVALRIKGCGMSLKNRAKQWGTCCEGSVGIYTAGISCR